MGMDPPEYGCNDDINVKDDDSILPEKCWQENRRGDSRKWLIRDGYPKKSGTRIKSTMKATYPYPFPDEGTQNIGAFKSKSLYQRVRVFST